MKPLDFVVETIDGKQIKLNELSAQFFLIVNTASHCVYTQQYASLERLSAELRASGVIVLGFPCNQFGTQEPGDNATIESFCERNFGVTFPLFAKVKVNGVDAHPLFQYLKTEAPGILGSKAIKWNFTKFLVQANGKVLKRYAPQTVPETIAKDIKAILLTTSTATSH